MGDYIKTHYKHLKKERVFVALFDGDWAGTKVRKELQGWFGKQGGYHSNKDFVSVRAGYAIEGLFSDEIIKDVYSKSTGIFDQYSFDAQGNVESFQITDKKKTDAYKLLTKRANEESGFDWARRFIALCTSLEEALAYQSQRLGNSS